MSTRNDSTDEARRVIALVKSDFVGADGALILEKTGTQVRPEHIFPDLGDVVPFFLYFGEDAFVESQVRLYEAALTNGFLVSQFASLGLRGLVKSYEYTDLLLGLTALFELRPNERNKTLLLNALRAADSAFAPGGRSRSFFHEKTRLPIPVLDTRDATLIECYIAAWRVLADESYLNVAKSLAERLAQTPFFKMHGLFADYEPLGFLARAALRGETKTRQATLCKNTTNALFAYLELYRVTGDARTLRVLMRMSHAVMDSARGEHGGIRERYVPNAPAPGAYLTSSFAVLDFLCDLAVFVPKEKEFAIRSARDIADFWLREQGNTGLFPLREGGKESFLDSETDMTVALSKLAEITNDIRYRTAAERCLDGIIRYHGKADYVLGVDVDTGSVINRAQRTKFLCLFLKALILKLEEGTGATIYGTPSLFELLKDR